MLDRRFAVWSDRSCLAWPAVTALGGNAIETQTEVTLTARWQVVIGYVSLEWGQMGSIRHHPDRKKLRISPQFDRTNSCQDVGSVVEMVNWIPGLGHKTFLVPMLG
jgi:hypothetical protein